MTSPRLWVLKEPYEFKDARKKYLIGEEFKLLTGGEMIRAIRSFNLSLPGNGPWSDALPLDFPRPVLRMPLDKSPLLAPDYFDLSWLFVSRRMREAMALPDWAVSYVPAEIETGRPLARFQDYALMYPRAFADVIDPEASQCLVETSASAKTGDSVTKFLASARCVSKRISKFLAIYSAIAGIPFISWLSIRCSACARCGLHWRGISAPALVPGGLRQRHHPHPRWHGPHPVGRRGPKLRDRAGPGGRGRCRAPNGCCLISSGYCPR